MLIQNSPHILQSVDLCVFVWVTEPSAMLNMHAHNKVLQGPLLTPPVWHYYADKWRDWAVLGSCWSRMLEVALNCVCHSPTPVLFVELTIQSHCDKCMAPTWIMDLPKGQTLGQKAVRPCGPLCVTSLTPYKSTPSQNWQWVVLHNPKLRSQSSCYN